MKKNCSTNGSLWNTCIYFKGSLPNGLLSLLNVTISRCIWISTRVVSSQLHPFWQRKISRRFSDHDFCSLKSKMFYYVKVDVCQNMKTVHEILWPVKLSTFYSFIYRIVCYQVTGTPTFTIWTQVYICKRQLTEIMIIVIRWTWC